MPKTDRQDERHQVGREHRSRIPHRRGAAALPEIGSLERPPADAADQRRDIVDIPEEDPSGLADEEFSLESAEADVADQHLLTRLDDEDFFWRSRG